MSSKHSSIEVDDETVEQASRFLAKLLRHSPEKYGLVLNRKGWTSMRDVSDVLDDEFNDESRKELLEQVISSDEENRFEAVSADRYGFIRATRNHTVEHVELPEYTIESDELSWYRMDFNNEAQPVYVEAKSVQDAKKVYDDRTGFSGDVKSATVEELEQNVTKSMLRGRSPPFRMIHQDPDKPLLIEKRSNQAGFKGYYQTSQPPHTRRRRNQ